MVRIKGIIVLLLWAQFASGQSSYMVFFTDKDTVAFHETDPQAYLSERAIERREKQGILITAEDFPVNPAYVSELMAHGATVYFTSRWKNAALVTTSQVISELDVLPFVSRIEKVSPKAKLGSFPSVPPKPTTFLEPSPTNNTTVRQLDMLNADMMHEDGYRGENMIIAILDDGFTGVDKYSAFAPMWNEDRLLATRDFVGNSGNVFQYDDHGTRVFSTVAGSYESIFSGTAPKSTFVLCVTEDKFSEYRIEEYNWLLGAEFADSVGADIINSSLGYSIFTEDEMNYTISDLDGHTAVVTQAADLAASKGMVVVVSAGNEGDGDWKYVTSPGDAFHVLTVGSVDTSNRKSLFSSVGPTADGRIKPDVCAMGSQATIHTGEGRITTGNGTSFAAPQIAGFAAGIWQANPDWSSAQVLEAIRYSGGNALNPDSLKGYGVPNYELAVTGAKLSVAEAFADDILVYPNPFTNNRFVIDFENFKFFGTLTIKVTNLEGKRVFHRKITQSETSEELEIEIDDAESGIFFLILENRDFKKTIKLVKI